MQLARPPPRLEVGVAQPREPRIADGQLVEVQERDERREERVRDARVSPVEDPRRAVARVDVRAVQIVVLDRLENQQQIGEFLDSRRFPNIEIQTPANLKQSHPRLSMCIPVDTSDVLVQALLQDQLDVVLGRIPGGARAEELLFDSLGEEELCVIAGARNPLVNAKDLSWSALQNETWVLQQHPSPMRAIVNQVFHNARVDIPNSIVETTSIMTLLSLVQQTDMLGITPVSVVEDYAGRDLLAVLPISFEARLPPYGLITRRHRIQSSAMQAFISSVKIEHSSAQG